MPSATIGADRSSGSSGPGRSPTGPGWWRLSGEDRPEGAPHRTTPWVNFAAGFGPDGFTAGGHVEGDGSEHAVTVRLSFNDGRTMEDTVENRVVLFFETGAPAFPARVDILDGRGTLLANYEEFDQGPSVG